MPPPYTFTATQAAALIESGSLSSENLVISCLERIAVLEETVGAWIHLDTEAVLAQARAYDQGAHKSPIGGIPVGVKDIIDTYDLPTGYGSPAYSGHTPRSDAACVAAVRAAGGVIMGKTVTTEFAFRHAGKTTNPHNPAHTPGGSSSGSAAAVAAEMVPLAFGTQTSGSVIRPAAYCGVVGYKASFSALPTAGLKPFAHSLDTVGAFARAVADMSLIRHAIVGATAKISEPAQSPRIGLCRTSRWDDAESAAQAAVELAARNLEKAGATIVDVSLPLQFSELWDAQDTIIAFEAARTYADDYRRNGPQLSAKLSAFIEEGRTVPYSRYQAAQDQAMRCRHEFQALFDQHNALLTLSAPGEAPKGLDFTGDAVFNRLWTLLHACTVTLPGYTGANGLPVGVQAVGGIGRDDQLLATATWMESRIL